MSHIRRFRPSKRRPCIIEVLESRQLLASLVVTNTLDSGPGSLRQAILDADAASGPSTIDFSISGSGVHDIDPATVLPDVTRAVSIDGTSQPGYSGSPLIEIFGGQTITTGSPDGPILSGLPYAMRITGDGARVSGVTFNYVIGPAVIISGSGNTLQGDVIGSSVGKPTTGDPNLDRFFFAGVSIGVMIQADGAGAGSNNTIGGTTSNAGNRILSQPILVAPFFDDNSHGVLIQGSNGGATGNLVEGNTISSDTLGVDLEGVKGNTIGGTIAGAGNTLTFLNEPNGIFGPGVLVNQGSDGTLIEGNSISGYQYGVNVVDSSAVTIGGTTPEARNVLSGTLAGIQVVDNSTTGAGLGELIEGNFLGTNAAGTAAIAGLPEPLGISILGSSFDTIGGSSAGAGNVISGNQTAGIELSGSITSGNRFQHLNHDLIQGNRIGTDLTGTVEIRNGMGIVTIGATDITIGGTSAGASNVISGNLGDGILLGGRQNTILGNLIGTDPTGTLALGNFGNGIDFNNGPDFDSDLGNTIGGTATGARNVISANRGGGITGFSADDLIQGNFIGTDASGTHALGNLGPGINVPGMGNTIGGTTPSAANVISANGGDGLDLGGTSNLVEGNFIGTDLSGTANLGNGRVGVYLTGVSNTVGGTVAGSGNTVQFNPLGQFVDMGINNVIFGNPAPIAIDLALSATVAPSAASTGSNVVFTFTVTNDSAFTDDHVQVFFSLPTPSTFALTAVKLPDGSDGVFPVGNPLTSIPLSIGTMAPGASYNIILIGVTYASSGTAEVDGTVVSAQLDPNLANNTARASVTISPLPADIGVVAVVPPGPALVGHPVPYTFYVGNFGPGTATNVQLAIVGLYPADAGIVGIFPSQGDLSVISTSAAFVNIGTLLPYHLATVTVIVVPFRAGGNATVFAFGNWPGPDPVPSDNPVLANIPIQAAHHHTPTGKVKPKTAAKTVHKASVPSPTFLSFLDGRAKKPQSRSLINQDRTTRNPSMSL